MATAVGYAGWRVISAVREESLRGEVALITGGSRGLGLLIAHELAKEGCKLVLLARDEGELARAREALRARGAEVHTVRCDVADQGAVERAVREATKHFGRVDLVVNNAGIIQVGPLESMTRADFEQAMGVMFWGPLSTTLAVLPQMRARGRGRIVDITSIGGRVAVPHLLPYTAAKFAHVGLSTGLRAELAKHGISVTTVVPGLMRTGSPVNAMIKGDKAREAAWFGMGGTTPLTSMSARRAARQIVRATKRRKPEVTLSWQAKALRLGHDLFPSLSARALALVDRFLPSAPEGGDGEEQSRAADVAPPAVTKLVRATSPEANE